MAGVAPLAREAALPGRNFNVAARDRRFLSRLAVPPFLTRHARPCAGHPRLPSAIAANKTWMAGSSPAMTKSDDCLARPSARICRPIHPLRRLSGPPSSPRTRPDRGDQITHHGAWRGGRVVECTALEMRHRCKPIGGSNPSLSASFLPLTIGLTTLAAARSRAGASASAAGHAFRLASAAAGTGRAKSSA